MRGTAPQAPVANAISVSPSAYHLFTVSVFDVPVITADVSVQSRYTPENFRFNSDLYACVGDLTNPPPTSHTYATPKVAHRRTQVLLRALLSFAPLVERVLVRGQFIVQVL